MLLKVSLDGHVLEGDWPTQQQIDDLALGQSIDLVFVPIDLPKQRILTWSKSKSGQNQSSKILRLVKIKKDSPRVTMLEPKGVTGSANCWPCKSERVKALALHKWQK